MTRAGNEANGAAEDRAQKTAHYDGAGPGRVIGLKRRKSEEVRRRRHSADHTNYETQRCARIPRRLRGE
jgi:hypothetical protein